MQPAAPLPTGGENSAKRDLASWWRNFKKGGQRKDEDKSAYTAFPLGGLSLTCAAAEQESQGIFGVPLQQSVRYANVAISLSDANGQSYIYGYVPIVVAKCGVFLKEKGTVHRS
jgi:hypothetical protein